MAQTYLEQTRKATEALKIPDAEQKAIDAAIEAKFAARQELQNQSLLLYRVAVDLESSEEQLDRAVKDFLAAKDRFQRRFREIDDELVKRISLRTRAKMLTTGTLDNGLGFLATRSPLASSLPAAGGPGLIPPRSGAPGFGPASSFAVPSPGNASPAAAAARTQPDSPAATPTGEPPR
jgi:hypothetical protein